MNNLIDKKWKIVKPVRTPFKVIVTDDWKCQCDKKGQSYKNHGCLCYPCWEVVCILRASIMPVFEHIVSLHNASLEAK